MSLISFMSGAEGSMCSGFMPGVLILVVITSDVLFEFGAGPFDFEFHNLADSLFVAVDFNHLRQSDESVGDFLLNVRIDSEFIKPVFRQVCAAAFEEYLNQLRRFFDKTVGLVLFAVRFNKLVCDVRHRVFNDMPAVLLFEQGVVLSQVLDDVLLFGVSVVVIDELCFACGKAFDKCVQIYHDSASKIMCCIVFLISDMFFHEGIKGCFVTPFLVIIREQCCFA